MALLLKDGRRLHPRPLASITFDPNIERALICIVDPSYCIHRHKLQQVKSREGRNIVETLLNSDQRCRILVTKLAKSLINSAIPQVLKLCSIS